MRAPTKIAQTPVANQTTKTIVRNACAQTARSKSTTALKQIRTDTDWTMSSSAYLAIGVLRAMTAEMTITYTNLSSKSLIFLRTEAMWVTFGHTLTISTPLASWRFLVIFAGSETIIALGKKHG
jgi:hypothetical protein